MRFITNTRGFWYPIKSIDPQEYQPFAFGITRRYMQKTFICHTALRLAMQKLHWSVDKFMQLRRHSKILQMTPAYSATNISKP